MSAPDLAPQAAEAHRIANVTLRAVDALHARLRRLRYGGDVAPELLDRLDALAVDLRQAAVTCYATTRLILAGVNPEEPYGDGPGPEERGA